MVRVAVLVTPPPLALIVEPDTKLYELLEKISPGASWGDRKLAAQKLGYLRDSEALPGLLQALVVDRFWMVRCAIIQAPEMIGDPVAIPTLRQVPVNDGFQVVRSQALKAIERLSS
jgi:HEAT repeat protein